MPLGGVEPTAFGFPETDDGRITCFFADRFLRKMKGGKKGAVVKTVLYRLRCNKLFWEPQPDRENAVTNTKYGKKQKSNVPASNPAPAIKIIMLI